MFKRIGREIKKQPQKLSFISPHLEQPISILVRSTVPFRQSSSRSMALLLLGPAAAAFATLATLSLRAPPACRVVCTPRACAEGDFTDATRDSADDVDATRDSADDVPRWETFSQQLRHRTDVKAQRSFNTFRERQRRDQNRATRQRQSWGRRGQQTVALGEDFETGLEPEAPKRPLGYDPVEGPPRDLSDNAVMDEERDPGQFALQRQLERRAHGLPQEAPPPAGWAHVHETAHSRMFRKARRHSKRGPTRFIQKDEKS